MISLSSLIPKKTVAKAALATTPATVPSTVAGVYSHSSERMYADLEVSNERLSQSQEEGVKLVREKRQAIGDKKVIEDKFSNAQKAKENIINSKKGQIERLKREIEMEEHSINEMKEEEYRLSDENEQMRSSLKHKNTCLAFLKNKRRTPECEMF